MTVYVRGVPPRAPQPALALLALLAAAGGACRTAASAPEQGDDASVGAALATDAPPPVADEDSAAPPRDREASSPRAYGAPRKVERGLCSPLGRPGGMFAQFVTRRDLVTSFVDGDDLLAIVNRSPLGTLGPDYAPADLVDIIQGEPRTPRACETRHACLRKEAAGALKELLREMGRRGFGGRIESAYRSYASQCGVFLDWSKKTEESTFCSAAEQSALAGHSQHQLGTTLDLFTNAWAEEGEKEKKGSFRDGFGCTPAGEWLAENAWRFGFVVPYPLHPDDRHEARACLARWDLHVPPNPKTGYRNEPWHLRYVGRDAAERFQADAAAARGTPEEPTLESWLRARAGLPGDADLPVCDGCACGACATLAPSVAALTTPDGGAFPMPCGERALWLGADGLPVDAEAAPRIVEARVGAKRKDGVTLVEVKIAAAPHTITQPPVVGDGGPFYAAGATYLSLAPYPKRRPHAYADLPRAWRVAVDTVPAGAVAWPYRASLAGPAARAYDRVNVYLPAEPGEKWRVVGVVLAAGVEKLRVTLLRDGEAHETRELLVR